MAFTIGIEEEFQTIDPISRELKSHMSEIVEDGRIILQERIKQEMHQSVVETGTNICQNIKEAREEVSFLRNKLISIAEKRNLLVAASGTHPFSDWVDQLITPEEHYNNIVTEMRDVARGNLIFGLHVHVGIEKRSDAVRIMNEARYFLPLLHALSTNSPFWCGRDTGFKSYRSKVFDKFPRTGIPDYFESEAAYDDYVNLLVKTNSIDSAKKIWWDIRVHPIYSTVEYRICDVPMRVDETICLAAIMQALTVKIQKDLNNNINKSYSRLLIAENKWRAARDGIETNLIDIKREKEFSISVLVKELLTYIDDVVDELGSRDEINYVHSILKNGTGADRQIEVYNRTSDLRNVVDYIVSETKYGL